MIQPAGAHSRAPALARRAPPARGAFFRRGVACLLALSWAAHAPASDAPDWTRVIATRSHDLAFGLVPDGRGGLYAGTIFQARFDATPFGGAPVNAPQGRNDSWVFALDAGGTPRWTRT
ncbi:MAG TPA: hypothetical protein VFO79_14255, partial [Xanthomonadales bacterium]|nr:hypothetical protein [Xanthomonadales bacterium]